MIVNRFTTVFVMLPGRITIPLDLDHGVDTKNCNAILTCTGCSDATISSVACTIERSSVISTRGIAIAIVFCICTLVFV